MTADDAILVNAFRKAYKSPRSIRVKQECLWSAAAIGIQPLATEVWITRGDGSTTIERGVSDDTLLGIAARSEVADPAKGA